MVPSQDFCWAANCRIVLNILIPLIILKSSSSLIWCSGTLKRSEKSSLDKTSSSMKKKTLHVTLFSFIMYKPMLLFFLKLNGIFQWSVKIPIQTVFIQSPLNLMTVNRHNNAIISWPSMISSQIPQGTDGLWPLICLKYGKLVQTPFQTVFIGFSSNLLTICFGYNIFDKFLFYPNRP